MARALLDVARRQLLRGGRRGRRGRAQRPPPRGPRPEAPPRGPAQMRPRLAARAATHRVRGLLRPLAQAHLRAWRESPYSYCLEALAITERLWARPTPPILLAFERQATPLARSCPCSATASSRAARQPQRPRDARPARSPCCHRTSPARSRPRRGVSRPEPAPSFSSWEGPSASESDIERCDATEYIRCKTPPPCSISAPVYCTYLLTYKDDVSVPRLAGFSLIT